MGSFDQYLNPDRWGDGLAASVNEWGHPAFWIAVLQIVLINVLLWGDNAVVIAMACRGLPPRQRFWGIVIGASVSALLLIVFTGVVGRLMMLPYLKLIGGVALLYIGAKLLAPAGPERNHAETPAQLWRVIRIVVVIDIIMSLDNVLAIAAAARGNLVVMVFGLAISIPIVLAGAALTAALLDRFPFLVWGGAALLGWIAGEVIATDPTVFNYLTTVLGDNQLIREVDMVGAAAGAVVVIVAGGLWRRSRQSKSTIENGNRH